MITKAKTSATRFIIFPRPYKRLNEGSSLAHGNDGMTASSLRLDENYPV
jgi:hypothetical protein